MRSFIKFESEGQESAVIKETGEGFEGTFEAIEALKSGGKEMLHSIYKKNKEIIDSKKDESDSEYFSLF